MQHIDLRDLVYVGLLAGLFILPKVLQRFRIPSAITALCIGLLWGQLQPEFKQDQTVEFLSSIGILALFLLAGLEVDLLHLHRRRHILTVHIAVRLLTIAGVTLLLLGVGPWGLGAALLIALALLTPSTGFILDSLSGLPLHDEERRWVKDKAIASELFALGLMFVALQTASFTRLLISSAVMLGMIAVIPQILRLLARYVTPYAPRSEFALLLIGAVICGYITKHLGAYYLVGAFLVGFIVGVMRDITPDFHTESIISSVDVFASLFIPFYFFHAGLTLPKQSLSLASLQLGILLVLCFVPLRVALIAVPRWLKLRESLRESLRVACPLLPTLVFTLVLSSLLYEQQLISKLLYGALIVYTLINSLLPALLFGTELLRHPPPHPAGAPEAPPAAAND